MPELAVSWVAIGALAGVMTYLWLPRRVPGGFFIDLLLGAIGGAIGGYLIATVTNTSISDGPITWGSLIVTVFSSLVMLGVVLTELAYARATDD